MSCSGVTLTQHWNDVGNEALSSASWHRKPGLTKLSVFLTEVCSKRV